MQAEVVGVHPGLEEEGAHGGVVGQARPRREGVAGPARRGRCVHHPDAVAVEELAPVVGPDEAGAQLRVGPEAADVAAPVDPAIQLRDAQQVVAGCVRILDVGGDETNLHAQGVAVWADALQAALNPHAEHVIGLRLSGLLGFVEDDLLGPGAGRPRLLLAHRRISRRDALLLAGPGQGAEHPAGVVRQDLVQHAAVAGGVGLGQEGALDAAVQSEVLVDRVPGGGLGLVQAGLRGLAAAQVEVHRARGRVGGELGDEQIGRVGRQCSRGPYRQRAGSGLNDGEALGRFDQREQLDAERGSAGQGGRAGDVEAGGDIVRRVHRDRQRALGPHVQGADV